MPILNSTTFVPAKSAVDVVPIGETQYVFSASISTNPVVVEYQRAFGVAGTFAGSTAPTAQMSVSASLDGTNFFGLPNPVSVTANGTYFVNYDSYAVRYVKLVVNRTSAAADATAQFRLCVI